MSNPFDNLDYLMGAVVAVPDPMAPWNDILIPNPSQPAFSEIGSFEEYLMGHFQESVENTLKQGLYEKDIPIGKTYTKICEADEVYVKNVDMIRRYFSLVGRNQVGIHALYRANMTVVEELGSQLFKESVQQWYEVSGIAEFTDQGQNISLITAIDIYDKNQKARCTTGNAGSNADTNSAGSPGTENIAATPNTAASFGSILSLSGFPLSEYLVPIIRKEDLDSVAHLLLQTYCPEVLKHPTLLNVKKLAKKLGLTIQCEKLSPDNSLLGKLVFQDTEVTLYDANNRPYQQTVYANTILIDHEANCIGNYNRTRWTILHEIIHYLLHYLFFQLQHMYNEELRCFSCETSPDYTDKSPLYWIEWQANQLVPRMLMPKSTTLQKIEALKQKYSAWHIGRMEMLERIIKELAAFFSVSQQCAKIRMIELGYPEAQSALNFVNGNRVPPFDATLQKDNQTFSVRLEDALSECEKNPVFREEIASGKYIYVESHFCLNEPKYVRIYGGKPALTSYARYHITECCLPFKISTVKTNTAGGTAPCNVHNINYSSYPYEEGSLMREQPLLAHVIEFDSEGAKSTNAVKIEKDSVEEFSNRVFDIMAKLPGSFGETLKSHMDRLDVTIEDLAEYSLISVSTIKRYRNDTESNIQLSTVIALCIGLHLEPILSLDLVNKAGFYFRANKTHVVYQMLITTMYMYDIFFCNSILESRGLPVLGKAS